jgi:transmembrane sensor
MHAPSRDVGHQTTHHHTDRTLPGGGPSSQPRRERESRRFHQRPWMLACQRIGTGSAARVTIASLAVILTSALSGVIIWRPSPDTASPSIREFDTPRGARSTVSLRDGTILTLGPATRLRVPPEYGRLTRTVELDGEGLFIVVHDSRHPFLVRTARTVVHDVGTTFTVVAYSKDPSVEVAVAAGEVSVADSALRARDVATIGVTGRLTVRHRADVRPYLAWSQGRLVFVDTPLREVMRVLDRTYDLQITLADSALGAQLITATFTNQPPDVVLDDVTAIVGAAYERSSRSVVIRRRARGAARASVASYLGVAPAQPSHHRWHP